MVRHAATRCDLLDDFCKFARNKINNNNNNITIIIISTHFWWELSKKLRNSSSPVGINIKIPNFQFQLLLDSQFQSESDSCCWLADGLANEYNLFWWIEQRPGDDDHWTSRRPKTKTKTRLHLSRWHCHELHFRFYYTLQCRGKEVSLWVGYRVSPLFFCQLLLLLFFCM